MKSNRVVQTAVLSLLALGVGNAAVAADKASEKCYGVIKAGKNDCQTASNACSGHSTTDGQVDAWIYLPTGTCERIVGASLTPKP
ncbi:MAG: hypothetical protein NFCOHLIN_00806 [Gammaproteobacteria bacterium]|nr:hypothetical protein [Gammaproteobacteria bacterium]